MTGHDSRKQALRALRQRDRATALDNLRQAEASLEKIESELTSTRRQVAVLEHAPSLTAKQIILAGHLEMDAQDRSQKQDLLQTLKKHEKEFVSLKKEAETHLNFSKDNVAKAQKAFKAIR